MTSPKSILAFVLTVGLSASVLAQENEADRNALFGELHIHTGWSFDAYMFNTRATPDDAYEFGKGKPLKHPLGETYQLSRPLDFMAVTDHGMFLGVFAKMGDSSHPLSKHPLASKVNSPDPDVMSTAFNDIIRASATGNPISGLDSPEVFAEAWGEIIKSANKHYDPGKFTTFIAYEWTSTPDRQNLHRNVIFRGDTAPLPYTRDQSMNPEDLWNWLDTIRVDGQLHRG